MDFSSMNGWDFERYCADCLLKKGFTKAEVTSGSGDHGVDIIAEQNGIRFGIQCKLYQGQIPNKAVQEAYTGASFYDCDIAVIMSNSELTKQAQEEAQKLRVKFWNVIDYIPAENPKENLLDSQNEASKTQDTSLEKVEKSVEPSSYQEYLKIQKQIESQIELKIKETSPISKESQTSKVAEEMRKYACRYRKFPEAIGWLSQPMDNPWRTKIRSIECYCTEVDRIKETAAKERLLLGKLYYMKELYETLKYAHGYGKYYWGSIENDCKGVSAILQRIEYGDADEKSLERFDLKYWSVCDWLEQYQQLISLIEKLFNLFGRNELAQISGIAKKCWFSLDSTENEMFNNLKGYIEKLFELWKHFVYCEKRYGELWRPWIKNPSAQKLIKQHENQIDRIYRDVINYKERAKIDQEDQRLLEQQKRDQAKRKEKQEKLKKQEELRRESIGRQIVEKYQEAIKKIDSDLNGSKNIVEHTAQVEIEQSKKQIEEFLKQKETFMLFKKKRDTELDVKIAALDRHIEQVKQNLADELARCEQNAEEKKSYLRTQIVNEAKEAGVQEVFLNNIM